MKVFLLNGLFMFHVLAALNAHAAAGDVDPSFNPGTKLDGQAYAIAEQPDGKIVITGDFTTIGGIIRHGIARLNPDGSADPTFDPGSGLNSHPTCVVLQPDGKVLVSGWFSAVNGVNRYGVARLNADGTLDQSFDPGAGADNLVFSLALQSDGKILVGGYFTHFAGASHPYLVRLNADGSVDTNFTAAADSYVYSLVVQPDDKILVGGIFTNLAGANISRIARLNADGTLDDSFNPGTGVGYFGVTSMALQPDGAVVIGGTFQTVNGAQHVNIARLLSNGSVDAGFNATASGEVGHIALEADGRIIVGGQFYTLNGVICRGLARLNTNGTLDATYQPPLNTTSPGISAVAVTSDGKALVSGTFDSYCARLNTDGTVAHSFNPSTGIEGSIVFMSKSQPDGKILIAGNFSSVKGQLRQGIARLESDGSLDTTFDPGPMLNEAYNSLSNPVVYCVALQSDGKVIIGGAFTNINGFERRNIARLNSDGSVDPSFNPGAGTDYNVYKVLLQPDGEVLMTGGFTTVDNVAMPYIARLNSDGSLDTKFIADLGGFPLIALQPDGKIIVAGDMATLKGIGLKSVGRLNGDGSLDDSFISVQFDNFITSLSTLADGRILVAGAFANAEGSPRNRLAILNPDGSLNADFHPAGPDDGLNNTLLGTTGIEQPDGKLIIWGGFGHFNDIACPGLVRLLPNGDVDSSFNFGTGANDPIYNAALQADGKILLSGSFTTVDGIPRGLIARLETDPPNLLPVIDVQPPNQIAFVGKKEAVFQVNASGAPTLVYQWYHNGTPLKDGRRVSGAQTDTLRIRHVQFHDSGIYSVTVTNPYGSVFSDPGALYVIATENHPPKPPAWWLRFVPHNFGPRLPPPE